MINRALQRVLPGLILLATVSVRAQHHHSDQQAEATTPQLILNGDARWMMDEHTRHSIATMRERFGAADPDSASSGQLRQLGEQLKADSNLLIQGCTMTGSAHEQLHHYLTAWLPAVDALTESGDRVDARRVGELLELFTHHFE